MKFPRCGADFETEAGKNYTKPLFAILILLFVAFFFVGFRLRGENEALKSNIG